MKDPIRTREGRALMHLMLEVPPLCGRLLSAGDRLVGHLRLTSSRWQVMGALRNEARTVSKIARVLGLRRQSVGRTVSVLESGGIVELIPNPDHRTAPLVRMTSRGQSVYLEVVELRTEWSNRLAAGMELRDLKAAIQVLRSLREALEAERPARLGEWVQQDTNPLPELRTD